MLLHQLCDDLVLLNELDFQLLNPAILQLFGPRWPTIGSLEGLLSLIEDLLDPGVDLTGLEPQLIGQVGNGLFVLQVTANDLGFLLGREMPACLGHRMYLRSGQYNPTGRSDQFQLRQDRRLLSVSSPKTRII